MKHAGVALPSVDAFTATKRSKLSSTRIRRASERASIEFWRCAIPLARSWYVALGCTAERKVLGSKDLEVMRTAASARRSQNPQERFERKKASYWYPCPDPSIYQSPVSHFDSLQHELAYTPDLVTQPQWISLALVPCGRAQKRPSN